MNSAAPTTADAVNSGVASCLAATPAVFTPSAPTTTLAPAAQTSGSPNGGGGNGQNGGAVPLFASSHSIVGIAVAMLCALGGGAIFI